MEKSLNILFFLLLSSVFGCEDADLRLAAEAGIEAVAALTLSDDTVRKLAVRSVTFADSEHIVAPNGNEYAERLRRLTAGHQENGMQFNYRVYLDDTVNAFAMADGSIRINSGLMDMLDDGELRFVIGHEIGHVVKNHVRHKLQLAYGVSAIRKGVAASGSAAGDLARSQRGAFAEVLMNARFSQLEEKAADDYGLLFLLREGYEPGNAITALRKLATLGAHHTFLSSHPDPEGRAERLELQLQGKDLPIEEKHRNVQNRIRMFIRELFAAIAAALQSLLSLFTERQAQGLDSSRQSW